MAAERHYFVINQNGQSADRRGPFVSADAAKKWAKTYPYPCWLVPAEYIGATEHAPLDENGERVRKD